MLNKYKYKTLAIGLEKEVYDKLDEYCKDKTYKSVFVRRLIKKVLGIEKSKSKDEDKKIIRIKVDNYEELEEYVKVKKFGSIESFATFAMAQYMSRFAIKMQDNKDNSQKSVFEA